MFCGLLPFSFGICTELRISRGDYPSPCHHLKNFQFNTTDIRVIDIDGEPWFPAKDVCDLLGIGSPSRVIRDVLDTDEYNTVLKANLSNTHISFPNRGMLCVSESGLYTLIFKSRKPEAQDFRKWVTSVVLPTIRKTGSYIAGEENFVAEGLTIDQMAGLK